MEQKDGNNQKPRKSGMEHSLLEIAALARLEW